MEQAQKTVDCLRRYLAKLNSGAKGCAKDREPIMKFVGLDDPRSLRSWLTGEYKPIGLRMVKVRYFLENLDYKLLELEKLDRKIYELGKLIAFGKLDLSQVSQELGYRDRSLLEILHGKKKTSQDKLDRINQLLQNFAKGSKEPSKISLPSPKAEPLVVKAAPAAESPQLQIVPNLEEETISLLGILKNVTALLKPRLDHLLSDKVSAESRHNFRQRAGRERVFDLSNEFYHLNFQLNSMCSEKARENEAKNARNQNKEVKE
ncbi:MAG: hypothetical protein NTX00_04605 [Candidatus Parcubacteria bacterium]|nr:hypothetical protein [Candidatus Parcubacteria bacterium]